MKPIRSHKEETNMSVAEVLPYSRIFLAPAILPSVMVVEDERKLRERLVEQLGVVGIEPIVATSGYEAIRLAAMSRPQLILLDGLLPEMHGFDVARYVRKLDSNYVPYIAMVTAIYKNVRYHNEAKLKYGIDDYIIKPVGDADLDKVIGRASTR